MSDERQYSESTEREGRARREAALRQIAEEQLGYTLPPAPPVTQSPSRPTATPEATRRSHLGRQIALTVLSLVVVLAGVGTYALVHARQSSVADPQPSQTAGSSACTDLKQGDPITNIRVSDDTYKAHSEPMLALNPANSRNLLGGSKFFTDPAHYRFQIGTFVSFDGGCTWRDNGVLPGFAPNVLTSDVTMAFGPANRAYVAVLYSSGPDSGIAVLTSNDGGKTFGQPVRIYDDPTGAVFSDKPWLTVDMSNGPHRGAVYVVWSYDYGGTCGYDNACKQGLAFSASTDGGATFSPVRQVEGTAPFCTNPATGRDPTSRLCDAVLGAIPAVLPDGTLAVGFQYFDLMSTGRVPTRLAVITSQDGGATWASPVLIATISDIAGYFPPDRYRNDSLPAFAADPAHGWLDITWADKSTGDADILFSQSSDEGKTWTAPVRVNDDPSSDHANQFQPQIAVAANGVVTIVFFDTRNDSGHHLIDVYMAQATDGGTDFNRNIRVTTQSWDPSVDAPIDTGGQQFIGDYQGLAVDDQAAYPFWNDTRTGSQEIFVARVPSAQP